MHVGSGTFEMDEPRLSGPARERRSLRQGGAEAPGDAPAALVHVRAEARRWRTSSARGGYGRSWTGTAVAANGFDRSRYAVAAPPLRTASRWFTHELWRWFDEFTSTPEGFLYCGDQIVVPVHGRARAKNGTTMDVHNVWSYEFSNGKLTRARVYADTAVLGDTVAGITQA